MEWEKRVLPHGELKQISEEVWMVTGSLPRNPLPRNMVVYRRPSGGLLIHSAVALREDEMQKLESLGEPKALIVPNGMHRYDAGAYKDRYPKIRVYAPEAARVKAEVAVAVDEPAELLRGDGVNALRLPGLKAGELAYELDSGSQKFLVLGDALMNLPNLPGFGGWTLKILGSSGFFGITGVGKLFLLKNAAEFRGWLTQLSARTDLAGLAMCHGDPVVGRDISAKLKSAADRIRV